MPRRFAVKIEGRERIVELDGGDDGTVRVDGVKIGVAIVDAGRGLTVLRQGNEQAVAHIDGAGGKLVVEVKRPGKDAVLVTAEVVDARRASIVAAARPTGDAARPVTIRSPIPGRVVKLLVRPGDRVAAGQTAVVLEAMKMENELRAPRAGVVQAVSCSEGATVEAGQDLVTMM